MTLYGLLIPAEPDRPASRHIIDERNELDDLQKIVGGCIEAVTVGDCAFIFDEEVKFKDHRRNERATAFLRMKGVDLSVHGDYLGGPVIIVASDETGATVSPPEEVFTKYQQGVGNIEEPA